MINVMSFRDAKPQLTEIIRSGNAALVIGAGASVSSGAPATAQLMSAMRSQFSLATQDDRVGFFDLGSDICDTPAYGRLDLIRFIADQLRDLEPSTHYKQLSWGTPSPNRGFRSHSASAFLVLREAY
jgi:hypothetical protein